MCRAPREDRRREIEADRRSSRRTVDSTGSKQSEADKLTARVTIDASDPRRAFDSCADLISRELLDEHVIYASDLRALLDWVPDCLLESFEIGLRQRQTSEQEIMLRTHLAVIELAAARNRLLQACV
jgi:hypothetical protein